MLEQFKRFDADAMGLDELMAMSAFGRALSSEYAQFGDVPEWVSERLESLQRAIRVQTADALAKSIKEAKLQLSRFKTKEEQRAEIEEKLKALETKAAGFKV